MLTLEDQVAQVLTAMATLGCPSMTHACLHLQCMTTHKCNTSRLDRETTFILLPLLLQFLRRGCIRTMTS